MNPLKIFSGLFILFWVISCSPKTDFHLAEKGILNLSYADLQDQNLLLNGQWEFYWQKLLTPQDFKNPQTETSLTGYFNVPGKWNEHGTQTPFSRYGFATFRLKIRLSGEPKPLALKLYRIFSAYKIFVNGEELTQVGQVGTSASQSAPQFHPQIIRLPADLKNMEIVFQISNFHHSAGGGPADSLILGLEENLKVAHFRDNALNIAVFSIGFILFLYCSILFFYRRNHVYLIFLPCIAFSSPSEHQQSTKFLSPSFFQPCLGNFTENSPSYPF